MHKFLPNDAGPIYAETLLGFTFPVEPLNTFSNLVFLGILIYWTARMRRPECRRPLLVFCLPILFFGYLGGTLFHATRSQDIWRILDFGAIYFLLAVVAIYFWRQLLGNWYYAALVAGGVLFASFSVGTIALQTSGFAVTGGYVMMFANIAVPTLLFAKKSHWRDASNLGFAIGCFLIAICFRQLDMRSVAYFSHGTHFLWHLFGGVGAQFLIQYLYLVSAPKNQALAIESAWKRAV